MRIAATLLLPLTFASAFAHAATAEIRISDAQLFFRAFDAAQGKPSASELQRDYLDAGSDGLRQFIPDRILSSEALAETVAKRPAMYEKTRACLNTLPDVRMRVAVALDKLQTLLPDASYPPVTIVVGRGNSGGTTGPSGVLIGLELICNASWLEADLNDRLVHTIAHEYIHVQQYHQNGNEESNEAGSSLLRRALVEGTADFIGELISGSVLNVHLPKWIAGRETEIATAFMKEKDGTDISHWLYNGIGTPERPGDLGYWIGYRIAKRFYEQSPDKQEAIRRLVQLKDPEAILAESGWSPSAP